jgi:glycosyltransferase involved in cell wall biosynthesis
MPARRQSGVSKEKVGVTIVVPCFDEEPGMVDLQRKLHGARELLEQMYEVHLVLVDDGSADNGWEAMANVFKAEPSCSLVRHATNQGIGAAILTGIRCAETEIVCSMDSDCSYDPRELEKLVPLLVPGVDLVTASPYHPEGEVFGVPQWRVWLSKAASQLYRRVLTQKLHTYTSCFRVYRRSAILKLKLKRPGFLGVAELIGKLDLQGSAIVECPARLSTRVHGVSKMKTAQVSGGHLHLLAELLVLRVWRTLFGPPRPCLASSDFNES